MRVYLLVVFLATAIHSFSQTPFDKINALKEQLTKTSSDSLSIKLMGDLCWYYRTVNMDSAFIMKKEQSQSMELSILIAF